MIDKPYKTVTAMMNDESQVVYNLIFRNCYYSLEGYRQGSNSKKEGDYCILENFTDDEGEAEIFLHRMVKGKVYPLHMKEIMEDFFLLR